MSDKKKKKKKSPPINETEKALLTVLTRDPNLKRKKISLKEAAKTLGVDPSVASRGRKDFEKNYIIQKLAEQIAELERENRLLRGADIPVLPDDTDR